MRIPANASPTSESPRRRASSRRRRPCARSRSPKLTNGGRLSRLPTSRDNDMGRLLLAAIALVIGLSVASAQGYPNKVIPLIVPFPAGGPTDTLARIMAERMKLSLGQPVIVENLSGAGGSL